MHFFLDIVAGAVTGILTGFGIGGGTLLILYLTMFRGTDQLAAQGINLLYFFPTAISALISHIKHRRIVWHAVLFAAGAGSLSTVAAALFASHLDTTLLRRIFGCFVIIIGVTELFEKKGNNNKTER